MRISVATKVLMLYIFLTYVPQTILAMWNPDLYATDYLGYADFLGVKLLFMGFLAIWLLGCQSVLRRIFPVINIEVFQNILKILSLRKVALTMSLAYLSLSIPFAIQYGFTFYHSGSYLSDLPGWVLIIQALKTLSRVMLAYYFIKAVRREKFEISDQMVILLNFVAGAISLMGSLDIIFLALTIVLLISQGRIIAQLTLKKSSASRNLKKYIYTLLIALSLPAVAVMGFANKIGFERTFELISDERLVVEFFLKPLAIRVASSHGSFIANAQLPLSVNEQIKAISYPVNNLWWRGCILIIRFNCAERGDITHLARLNFIRTYYDQSPVKAGATPGLLASVVYFPMLPISMLIFGAFCALIGGAIQNAVGACRFNVYGYLLILLFVYPMWENPIDQIVLFDPAVIYVVGMIGVLFSWPRIHKINGQQIKNH